MPDRNDPAQPPTGDVAQYEPTQPNTDMFDSQAQNSPSGNAATGDELAGYYGPDFPIDPLNEKPGETYVQYVTTTTEYGDYRPAGIAGQIANAGIQLAGWNFIDLTTGATPFTVTLRDGTDNSAPAIAVINLSNASQWLLPGGIRTRFGLYVDFTAGTPTGTVYTRSVRAD